jgi:hypothetical protein
MFAVMGQLGLLAGVGNDPGSTVISIFKTSE